MTSSHKQPIGESHCPVQAIDLQNLALKVYHIEDGLYHLGLVRMNDESKGRKWIPIAQTN
jgi:hypothetical protein